MTFHTFYSLIWDSRWDPSTINFPNKTEEKSTSNLWTTSQRCGASIRAVSKGKATTAQQLGENKARARAPQATKILGVAFAVDIGYSWLVGQLAPPAGLIKILLLWGGTLEGERLTSHYCWLQKKHVFVVEIKNGECGKTWKLFQHRSLVLFWMGC